MAIRGTRKLRWLAVAGLGLLGFLTLDIVLVRTGKITPSAPSNPSAPGAAAAGDVVHMGDVLKVAYARQANGREGFWPCGSSKEALDEMIKWAVGGDQAEVKRVMGRTRSIGLTSGLRVKVLDTGGFLFSEKKVRVVANSEGKTYDKDEKGSFLADPRIGRECWIVNEALTR